MNRAFAHEPIFLFSNADLARPKTKHPCRSGLWGRFMVGSRSADFPVGVAGAHAPLTALHPACPSRARRPEGRRYHEPGLHPLFGGWATIRVGIWKIIVWYNDR